MTELENSSTKGKKLAEDRDLDRTNPAYADRPRLVPEPAHYPVVEATRYPVAYYGTRNANNNYLPARNGNGYRDDGAVQCSNVCLGGNACLMTKGVCRPESAHLSILCTPAWPMVDTGVCHNRYFRNQVATGTPWSK